MERVGEVTAVKGGRIEVTFCRPADCAKCHACIGGSKQTTIWLEGKAEVGDSAVVTMPVSTVIKASAMAYVIPLVGLLGGAVIGSLCGSGDVPTAIGGAVGLLATLAGVLINEKKRRADASWSPVLKEILPKGTPVAKEE